MSKSSRNLGAVLAVLVLGLLIAGLVFVVVTVYRDPMQAEQTSVATEASGSAPAVTETSETVPEEPTRIALFETSDIHGYLIDTTSGDPTEFQYRMAHISKVVNDARASKDIDDVILVDGGDIYQGSPLSNLTDGAALRAAIDIMDYDAVTLGNHEFDWDVEEYAADTFCTVPAYELGEFSGDPDTPVIAANLCYSNNHSRTLFTKDYVIVEKAGYRIALIGYIPDYSDEIMTSKIAPYEIHDDFEEFEARIKDINEGEKPDVTIVIAHQNPVLVADALSHEDVDVVCGGHEHAGIAGVADNGIPYIQALNYAQGYASAVIVIDSEGNVTVEDPSYTSIIEEPEKLYDTLGNASEFDPEILKLSHAAWDSISDGLNEALGYIDSTVEKKGYIDDKTTTGGNFITGLMLEYTRDEGVVAAFFNRGGVRADFVVPEGGIFEISVGDVYAISPFNNYWLIYDLSGEELAKLIVDGYMESNYGDQVSGLTYEYYNHGTAEEPDIEIASITLDDGTKVDIHGTDPVYRVCVTNYSATQPDSVFEGKTPLHAEADSPIDNQAIIELLRERRDSGNIHIPTDNNARGTCLNADEVAAAEENDDTTGTTETTETTAETTAEAA